MTTHLSLQPANLPAVASTMAALSTLPSFSDFPFVPHATTTSNCAQDVFSSLVLEAEGMTSPQADRVLGGLRYMDAGNWDPYDNLAHTNLGILQECIHCYFM